jgi:hypothetical protein
VGQSPRGDADGRRLFKGGVWVEAGVTNGGKLQAMAMAMAMVNF